MICGGENSRKGVSSLAEQIIMYHYIEQSCGPLNKKYQAGAFHNRFQQLNQSSLKAHR
jgi:hypothetical protein